MTETIQCHCDQCGLAAPKPVLGSDTWAEAQIKAAIAALDAGFDFRADPSAVLLLLCPRCRQEWEPIIETKGDY